MDVSLFFCALLAVHDMRLFLVATRLGRLQTTRAHLFLLNDESRLLLDSFHSLSLVVLSRAKETRVQ